SQDDATISFSAIYTHYFNNNASLKIGSVAEYSENYILFTTLDSIQTNYSYVVSGENEMLFNSNFIQIHFEPLKKTYLDVGVKSIQHFTDHKAGRTLVTNDYLVERATDEIIPVQPQVKFGFNIGKKQLIELNWQSNSQKQTSSALYSLPNVTPQNLKLESTQNNTYNILYLNSISNHSNFSSQLYFQDISNVPVAFNNGNHYSLLNNHAQIIDEALTNDGTGNNYGLDLSFQKTFSKQYYLLANTSLYESTFKDANNKTRSTTYDGRYLVNLTAGYEKPRRKNTNSFFGANIRVFNQGGYRHTPIDTAASHLANKTIYNNSEFNSLQYPDYFRVDVGIRFAKNKAKATRTWSIDIQNITNNNNVAYKYYDIYFKKIKTKYHLGIIPVFNYKIEF
ncbi:MAG: hypothetical protein HKO56_03575, partial [Bacteroidia bacterium]|nr:hypothetical protein [Bacteroidia bacterium]